MTIFCIWTFRVLFRFSFTRFVLHHAQRIDQTCWIRCPWLSVYLTRSVSICLSHLTFCLSSIFLSFSLSSRSLLSVYLWLPLSPSNYIDVIMSPMASQITSLTIVYSTVYSGADQRKHQSSASLAFVRGIHRWPVNSPHKGPVTRKMFPFDDVIMLHLDLSLSLPHISQSSSHVLDNPNENLNWFHIHFICA